MESGKAKCFGTDEDRELNDGDFYGEEAFITTLSMMVEDNAEVRAYKIKGYFSVNAVVS